MKKEKWTVEQFSKLVGGFEPPIKKKYCCVADMVLSQGKDLISTLSILGRIWEKRHKKQLK